MMIGRSKQNLTNLILQFKTSKWLEAYKEIYETKGRNYWEQIKKLSKYKVYKQISRIEENNQIYESEESIAQAFKTHYEKYYTETENEDFNDEDKQQITNWYEQYFQNDNNFSGNSY